MATDPAEAEGATSKRRARSLLLGRMRRWHRWVGLVAAVFVVVLAITGMLLNHTEGLRLDERRVQASWLLAWYGIDAEPPLGYRAGDGWLLYQIGDELHLNGEPVAAIAGEVLRGAFASGELLVAVTDRRLHLLLPTGELVESLGPEVGIPGLIEQVGRDGERYLLRGDAGVVASADGESWQAATDGEAAVWQEAEALGPELAAAARAAIVGDGLPLERIVLDLHSGRLFGRFGHLVMDAAAILMLLLTASGLWLHFGGRRRRS